MSASAKPRNVSRLSKWVSGTERAMHLEALHLAAHAQCNVDAAWFKSTLRLCVLLQTKACALVPAKQYGRYYPAAKRGSVVRPDS